MFILPHAHRLFRIFPHFELEWAGPVGLLLRKSLTIGRTHASSSLDLIDAYVFAQKQKLDAYMSKRKELDAYVFAQKTT